MIPDSIIITIFTFAPLHGEDGLERMLAAFESAKDMTPTHWGPDARTRNLFQHREMVDEIAAYKNDMYSPCFARRKPLRYKAFFTAKSKGLCKLQVEFTSLRAKDVSAIFEIGTTLGQGLQAVLGFVHPIWELGEVSQQYSASGVLSLAELQQYGLNPVCARTWYNRVLTDKIGERLLSSCGLEAVPTAWGGVQLDLVAEPWRADFETLSARQKSVMQCLFPSGMFADYSQFGHFRPGTHWTSLQQTV